jgi:DNA-binding CsgD family transcriptional regulator
MDGVLSRFESRLDERIVGREAELAAVSAFLRSGAAQPVALVLQGEAGMGKTSVLRAALAEAVGSELRVFVAWPAAGEMELPYVGLGDLLASVRSEVFAGLVDPQRAALEAALVRQASTAPVEEHALSRGLLELLRFEAARAEILVVVDDVQWLDRSTASALSFALRRLGSAPLRVLLAMRTESGAPAELPLGLADWERVQRLEIGPLSTTELGAVIRKSVGKQLARPQLEALARDSRGNPMLALELAQRDPGRGRETAPTLTRALNARLPRADSGARAALGVAACALRPSTDLLLCAGVERSDLRAAMESGMLIADGERLSFAHPLLATVVYEALLPDERREIHAKLATASASLVERGHHVSRSAIAPDAIAAETLELAAGEAARLGDHAGAAAFLLRAAELSVEPGGEVAHGLELRAATELDMAGDVEAAAAIARRLVDRLPPGIARARARELLVFCSVGPGFSFEDALAELALAVEDAGDDEAARADLHALMAEISSGLFRFQDAAAQARTAIGLAERVADSATAVTALSELGIAECMLGGGVSEASRAAYARWDGNAVSLSNSPGLNLAVVMVIATAFEEAEQIATHELALAEERGLEPIECMARGVAAEAQLRAGSWAEAHRNARMALEHARQAAYGQAVTGASYALAMIEALLGHHEEARSLATHALAEADRTQDLWHRISHRAVIGLLALGEDRPQEAVDVLTPAWALMLGSELGDLSFLPVAQVLGEALVAVGRLDDALDVARTLRGCPAGERPWCRAMAGRLEALVASAGGDSDAAREAIAAALESHAELPEPFEHARTVHIAGRIERGARQWGAARAALVDALERFDALGAAGWAEKTAADIARLPGRRPAAEGALTVTEERVARRAASGLSNKEIAAELFVSVHTVEKHLSHAYAKLGTRSRNELARRLDEPGAS